MRKYFREILLLAILLVTAVGAHMLRPALGRYADYPELEKKLPAQVGEWQKLDPTFNDGSYVAVSTDANLAQPYNELTQRTYQRGSHDFVMLVLAWGQQQKQEVKIHNPEICYKANGFQLVRKQVSPLQIKTSAGSTIVAKQVLAQDMQGYEAVTYWVRVGDHYTESSLQTRLSIIEHGLRGEIPDGILVRASQRLRSAEQADAAFKTTQQFLETFYAALPATTQAYLVR